MLIFKDLEEKKKELFDFSPSSLKNGSQDLEEFFKSNLDTWIANAKKLRDQYPVEVAKFFAELFRSDFTLKFMYDGKEMVKHDFSSWSYDRKLDFISDLWENMYHYFSFLTFSISYEEDLVNRLRPDWFLPEEAKQYKDRKAIKRPWQYRGKPTTGKRYILQKCPLFSYCPSGTDLVPIIRNKDSHSKTIVREDKVILLDGKNSRDITKEVDMLSAFLLDAFYVTYEFHMRLIVLHRFWMMPAILLTIPEKFNYKKRIVLFDLFCDIKEKEEQAKKKSKRREEDLHNKFFIFVATGIDYTTNQLWEHILEEKPFIDNLLNHAEMEMDASKLKNIRHEVYIAVTYAFYLAKMKIKEWVFKEKVTIVEIDAANIETFDLYVEIKEFGEMLRNVLELPSKEKEDAFKQLLLVGILLFSQLVFAPLSNLQKSFKTLFIEKTKALASKKN